MISILRFCSLTLFLTLPIPLNGDRRKEERECRPLPFRGAKVIHSDLTILSRGGSYVDYEPNRAEQYEGYGNNNRSADIFFAKVYGNWKVDAAEVGTQSDIALPLEGRSFCLSGEHFKNVPELLNHLNFRGMRELAWSNFDIGTHTDPSDYSLPNIFPWPDTNLPDRKPQLTIFSRRADDGEPIYAWEDSEETFFHTRVTRQTTPAEFAPRQLHQGFRKRPAVVENQPDRGCQNPYFIDVTEIDANGVRLHNWLHITVYVKRENIIRKRNCATGKMRYIMLEVRDKFGLPVGDFNAEVDCGTSCKCKSSNCKMINGTSKNAMPCMVTPLSAVTQPGLYMYSAAIGQYFDEVHVHWHFSQHTSYFVHQLNFAALIVERSNVSRYYTSRQTGYTEPLFCEKTTLPAIDLQNCPLRPRINNQVPLDWIYTENQPPVDYHQWTYPYCYVRDMRYFPQWASKRANPLKPRGYYAFTLQHIADGVRPYGWTAQYTVVNPTLQTLGAWDIFRPKYVQISRMNCHKRLDSEFFDEGPENRGRLPKRSELYRWIQNYSVYPANGPFGEEMSYNKEMAIKRARNDSSNFRTKYMDVPVYTEFGLTNDTLSYNLTYLVPKFYFGTEFMREEYKPSEYSVGLPPDVRNYLNSLQTQELIADQERCACPALATTEDPESVTRPVQELRSRASHGVQMFLAWIVLVPIGLFSIRYYKETYSRVFLLQEFWWYSVHVLCMGTAWIFMLGGIYAIEIKKVTEYRHTLTDEAFVHIILGSAAIVLFTIQLFVSAFRLWSVKWRVFQIILHFTFGMIEYAFAAACILLAAAIPQGRMSCSGFAIYVSYLAIQAIVYVIMEYHMGYVDKLLDLFPPRSYLPPPVIRLFHTSAPMSKFRIYILAFYAIFCWVYFHIMQQQISTHIASCFKNLGNDYDEESF